MPLSKKRKKRGKKVKHDPYKAANQESGISLQDLINILAYQEVHGIAEPEIDFADPDTQAVINAVSNTIIADDVEVHMPEIVPVTVGEGENKREVGTASPIPGDPEHVSINITDPEILKTVQGPIGNYSIDNPEILQDPGGKYSIDTKEQN